MMLGGQRVLPAALQGSGFTFTHPGLEEALRHTLA
jgi:NAD dependent epimerase/dehydratase family enzyme